jgi:hypothetical protein
MKDESEPGEPGAIAFRQLMQRASCFGDAARSRRLYCADFSMLQSISFTGTL